MQHKTNQALTAERGCGNKPKALTNDFWSINGTLPSFHVRSRSYEVKNGINIVGCSDAKCTVDMTQQLSTNKYL